jgi:biotin transport system substrate-specific component
MNYSEILISQKSLSDRILNITIVIGASWLIALSAQYSINLPFSPVPITGQTLVILLAGLILGKNRGSAAVGLYLFQGAAGLPFFAGGRSGVVVLLGPTGGYLLGFLAAVYIVGMLSELNHRRSLLQTGSALVIGNLIIYAFGLIWLARFVGESQVLALGLYPFLAGDFLKISLGLVITGGSKALINQFDSKSDLG